MTSSSEDLLFPGARTLALFVLTALVAVALGVLHTWPRLAAMSASHRAEKAARLRDKELHMLQHVEIEVATLEAYRRVDRDAREKGLAPADPARILSLDPPPLPDPVPSR